MSNEHIKFIEKTIELSKQSVHKTNHPFGAILVKDGKVILEAENTVITENDVTRHAELNLVSQANKMFDKKTLSESILYTSTEPCVMCSGAIYWSGIKTIVYSCSAEKLGEIAGDFFVIPSRKIFSQTKAQINIIGPILESESAQVHKEFW